MPQPNKAADTNKTITRFRSDIEINFPIIFLFEFKPNPAEGRLD
jgi:hypothetical protein